MNVPVIIVGAGPTGLTAATLLAQNGVECLVLERWESVYPQPRAVHLDDEVYRILARLGLARRVRRHLPSLPRAPPCRPGHAGAGRVPARHRPGPARLPPGEHVRPTRSGTAAARQPQPVRHRHHPGRRRGHRPDPGRHRTGAGRRTPTGPPADGDSPRRLRAGLRRRQQHHPRRDRRHDARPALPATLAGRRRRHHRRPRCSGTACTRSATPSARRRTCASERPATGGSSGSSPTKPPTTSATSPGLHPLHRAVDQGHPGRAAGDRPGRRVHLPRPGRRPVAGPPDLPARRRRPPHPAVHRAGHGRRACATRPTSAGSSPASCTADCPTASWTPTRSNASRTSAP